MAYAGIRRDRECRRCSCNVIRERPRSACSLPFTRVETANRSDASDKRVDRRFTFAVTLRRVRSRTAGLYWPIAAKCSVNSVCVNGGAFRPERHDGYVSH